MSEQITQLDVPYSREFSDARRLDVFLPGPAANGCAILWIHGGGWGGGNRRQWHKCAEHFRELGYVCVSTGYRLAPATHWPGQVEDVRLAMAWLRGRAGEFGIDAHRIAAIGSSAGGHLVAMLATIDIDDPLGATGELALADTRPDAAVCYCPVLTVHENDRLAESVLNLMGGREAEMPAAYRDASPLDRITGDEPPMLFLHGNADELVPLDHSKRMAAALHAAGAQAELQVLPGVEHGFGYGVTTDAQKTATAHVTRFLAECFGVAGSY